MKHSLLRKNGFYAGFLLCLFLVNCTSTGSTQRGAHYPQSVNEEMRQSFLEAEKTYAQKKYGEALSKYQAYLQTYGYNELSDEADYKIGKIYILQKKYGQAATTFEALAEKTPSSAYKAKGLLMSGFAGYKQESWNEAATKLRQIKVGDLPTKLKLQFYSLYYYIGEKANLPQDERDYALLRMVDLYQESADESLDEVRAEGFISKTEALKKLENWVATPLDHIPAWFKNYPSGYSKPFVQYKAGRTYFDLGQKEKAKSELSRYTNGYPTHVFVLAAKKLLASLGENVGDLPDQKSILGVILPLSGAQRAYGMQALNGLECAMGKTEECQKAVNSILGETQPLKLAVRDAGQGSSISAQVSILAQEGVLAIVGPMSSGLVTEASQSAEANRVPLLPFTQKNNGDKTSDYVFQIGFSATNQVAFLVKEARSRGLKNFAILYPENNFGKNMNELFVSTVKANGGNIVAESSYNTKTSDATTVARNLKASVSRYNYSALSNKTVPFDAVFIPDAAPVVNKLVTGFQNAGITGMALMGPSTWNDFTLTKAAFGSFPNSFFVDFFNSQTSSSQASTFVKAYQASFGRMPTSLDAMGFDSGLILLQAVKKTGKLSSEEITKTLSSSSFKTVTGLKKFGKGSDAVIEPVVVNLP